MADSRSPRIRRAEPRDKARFLSLWSDFVRDGPEPCAERAAGRSWASVMTGQGGLELFVAEGPDGAACGFALIAVFPWPWAVRDACYLLDLYVAPEARRAGIGTALLEHLAEEGRARGWLKVFWMTQADNARARALYDRIATVSPLVRYDRMLNPHD